MTPNLPDLYARVTAKRPELAVEGLEHKPCWCGKCGSRWTTSTIGSLEYPSDVVVSSLILAKWVEALPVGVFISRIETRNGSPWWFVATDKADDDRQFTGPTPLEALAAFWMEYNPSPKESDETQA